MLLLLSQSYLRHPDVPGPARGTGRAKQDVNGSAEVSPLLRIEIHMLASAYPTIHWKVEHSCAVNTLENS